jgi:hypothetical protein
MEQQLRDLARTDAQTKDERAIAIQEDAFMDFVRRGFRYMQRVCEYACFIYSMSRCMTS